MCASCSSAAALSSNSGPSARWISKTTEYRSNCIFLRASRRRHFGRDRSANAVQVRTGVRLEQCREYLLYCALLTGGANQGGYVELMFLKLIHKLEHRLLPASQQREHLLRF